MAPHSPQSFCTLTPSPALPSAASTHSGLLNHLLLWRRLFQPWLENKQNKSFLLFPPICACAESVSTSQSSGCTRHGMSEPCSVGKKSSCLPPSRKSRIIWTEQQLSDSHLESLSSKFAGHVAALDNRPALDPCRSFSSLFHRALQILILRKLARSGFCSVQPDAVCPVTAKCNTCYAPLRMLAK